MAPYWRWLPLLLGSGLWGAAIGHFILDSDPALVDAIEIVAPFLVGSVLTGYSWRMKTQWTPKQARGFALWLLAGTAFGVCINLWFLFIISLEHTPPGESLVMNANGIAAGVVFSALIGYYYNKLETQNRELRETNERLEDFTSVVSHDLRNPLNILQGHLDLARETGGEKHFDAIERAANRMEQLVNQVLTLARISDYHIETKPVDIGAVARQAVSTVDTGNLDVSIETDITLEANAERLRTLFENLIRNAVDHGSPTITSIKIGELDDRHGFFVEDNGVGIPPEKRELVFEGGYSTKIQGTGFGLSIVRQISDAHGWKHTVTESTMGGARIEIYDHKNTGSFGISRTQIPLPY